MEKGLTLQGSLHGLLIAGLGGHLLLEQFAQQLRNARIMASRLDARPAGYVFFEGNRHIAKCTLIATVPV